MNRVGEFEKVSFEQFYADMKDEFYSDGHCTLPFPISVGFEDCVKRLYENIRIPERATSGSAGYDFKAPFGFALAPGETIKIPTGIRVSMEDGWWLGCLPRSGMGFKYRLQLNNTMGVIDSDYYFADNEGHIFAKLTNDTNEGKTICISAGESFMQAIFLPYGITYSDNANGIRNGGIGSTSTM